MTEDEPRIKPTDDRPTADEASDSAKPREVTDAPKVPLEPAEPDKTDMSAVGDDGQVFGG